MNRTLRLLYSAAAALALAFGISFAVVAAQVDPPPAAAALQSEARPARADGSDYDLARLQVLSRAIDIVDRTYVDQKRIDPRAMVVAALDNVEKTVAEVLAEGDAANSKLSVTVGQAQRTFDLSGMKTIFDVRVVLGDVMAFVQRHLVVHKNLREIEYAAVNGMLSTLDPHSVLLDERAYRDMRVATKGEFGGLGFVISMRDGNLTVLRVLRNTPAQRAGIKAKDVILRIEDQSTVNMDLQDAVDRLRGRPDTRVTIALQRAGWPEPRRLTLVRESINFETVPQTKLLDRGIGYVRISGFSGNTTRDLLRAVQAQRVQAGGSLRGLILDLRNNPGGLLEQAIQISDAFLPSGVIVKTVGGDGTKVTEAHEGRDDLTLLPLVVLVNNQSASASEIVAGALKNNNRALILGRQTFGKGSVQVLNELPSPGKPGEELAVKLTIAQYLTPGDVSIQEVGIAPDVLLIPGRALKGAVNFFAPPRVHGEADLDHHLVNPSEVARSSQESARREAERALRTEKSALELRYLLDEKEDQVAKAMRADERREAAARAHSEVEVSPEQQEDEDVEANPDELVEDYQIRFAKELLARHPYADRPRLIEAARLLVSEKRSEEALRLQQKLAAMGVDWSAPSAGGTPRAAVTVAPAPGKRAPAGETLQWTVSVKNDGDGPFRRLRAWSVAQRNTLLDRKEFVFGLVRPGETRSWTVPVKLPRGMDSRHDEVKLHFEDDGGRAPPDFTTALDAVEVPKPAFALSAQFDDDRGGNGDGLVQRGEELTLRVDVRNAGPGPSGDRTFVSLKSLGDEKVFIKKGRAVLGTLRPGEVKQAAFQLEVRRGLRANTVPLRLTVFDEKTEELVNDRLEVPVRDGAAARTPSAGAVKVTVPQAAVRAGASPDAPPLALARRGTVLTAQGRIGDAIRVEWQKGRFGFVAASEVVQAQGRPSGAVAQVWQREPPRIALSPDPTKGAPVVDADKVRVEGRAELAAGPAGARTRLRDVFIFVNDQKVFFKVAPGADATNLDFAADVPLKPGNNVVTVFAREDEEYQVHRSFVVHRRVSEVAAQAPGAPAQGK